MYMSYKIYIANKARTTVLQMQFTPAELPTIGRSADNESFKTWWNGNYNFIEKPNLRTVNLECWWTERNLYYKKASNKPIEYINLINNAMDKAEPIQLIIIKADGSTYINSFFSVDSFEYHADKIGDIQYNLQLTEYREVTTAITSTYKVGWNKNDTGWWYSEDGFEYYQNTWKLINGDWYYFKADGYAMQWEWLQYQGEWYFFDLECKMVRGKWLQINGKWYYFYAEGIMARNTTIDGYILGADGAWV